MKKIKYTIISLAIAIGLKACWVKDTQQTSLKGIFINESYLAKAADTLLSTIPFYCTELVFDHPDSVLVRNGVEEYFLNYQIHQDTCFVKNAYQHEGKLKDLVLIVKSDTSFVALDQDFTGNNRPALFHKTSIFKGFEYGLNNATLAGNYAIVDGVDSKVKSVTFSADGRIEGLPAYRKFSVCYSGDCVSESTDASNIIMLENVQNKFEYAVWRLDKTNGKLTIFKLTDARPDIKGDRAIKSTLLEAKKIS
ncbi:hypothetical protein [Runella sp.]|uniref:hypothetical protein n=1 Tax=Runella sp. TaxID=1960881 RepID=UPI003D0C3F89